jgi:hypothetical protein
MAVPVAQPAPKPVAPVAGKPASVVPAEIAPSTDVVPPLRTPNAEPSSRVVLPDLPDVAPIVATPTVVLSDNLESVSDSEAADVKAKWGRCVALVGEKNVTLPLILNNAEVLRAENGKVVVGFPYAMHVNKMNEMKNLRLIEDAIEAILMKKIGVIFVHNKIKQDEAVADLLEAFGGAVV